MGTGRGEREREQRDKRRDREIQPVASKASFSSRALEVRMWTTLMFDSWASPVSCPPSPGRVLDAGFRRSVEQSSDEEGRSSSIAGERVSGTSSARSRVSMFDSSQSCLPDGRLWKVRRRSLEWARTCLWGDMNRRLAVRSSCSTMVSLCLVTLARGWWGRGGRSSSSGTRSGSHRP